MVMMACWVTSSQYIYILILPLFSFLFPLVYPHLSGNIFSPNGLHDLLDVSQLVKFVEITANVCVRETGVDYCIWLFLQYNTFMQNAHSVGGDENTDISVEYIGNIYGSFSSH